jgi:fatty acid desaturase
MKSMGTAILSMFGYLGTAIFIARQQRGLELMVHDASHGTWHRLNRDFNNKCADLVVAYPVLSLSSPQHGRGLLRA